MSANAQSVSQDEYTQGFTADVSRLLDIVANALYTNHDVFLRELVSNAADACDKLRYEAVQNPDLIKDNTDFKICIYNDTTARTLTLTDNGIGMSAEELATHLGTIAHSGTAALVETMKQQKDDPLKLIGQFGVGFYAGYMVASKIEVVSRKAGSDEINLWESDGKTGFVVKPATDTQAARLDGARGTAVTLHIKDSACEFLLDAKVKATIVEYSDHIDVPIFIGAPALVNTKSDETPVNAASALWTRPRAEISNEDYTAFYHQLSGGYDEPLHTAHWRAEGAIEFTSLLYVPTLRPWDLFDPSRKTFVKLYVRRVFITDELETLMYPWLRFARGVIDSEDLPLNISRESLQYNPVIEKIKSTVARRLLNDFDKLSRNDPAGFTALWGQFGAVLKEGLYDAPEHREALLKICRFYSSTENGDKFVSLEQYVERMKDGQDTIYYISGESLNALKNSPQLEGFRARGVEVLFFTDTIDDFWLQSVLDYKDFAFQSITKGTIDLDKFNAVDDTTSDSAGGDDKAPQDAPVDETITALTDALTDMLKDQVQQVRISKRLTDSPVCLVAADDGVDMYMERVLKLHQKYQAEKKPVLEINPSHALIKKLAAYVAEGKSVEDAGYLLLDQAKIIQGEPIHNPAGFMKRVTQFMHDAM